ncbi:MAG: class A beta-lactamase-related serine hydrolase [Rubrivivax sp.]|nr:MAG: class A beta-lactamase-related serine hydrolase [Rubrivivax sp.]
MQNTRRHLLGAALAAPALATAAAPSARAGAGNKATAAFNFSPQRLGQALKAMVDTGRAAGVSAVVWQGGSERYFGAFGLADREARRPMARNTLVRIWSMTKPVASAALMQLWDAGRFRLDDPVSAYLPEFKSMRVHDAKGERPAERPILVRDVLRHTAGLTYGSDDGPAEKAFEAADPFGKSPTLAAFSRNVAALPLVHEPGMAWHYGTAIDIVARLVEVLAGQPFDAYLEQHVLQPLGMRETAFVVPAALQGRMAATYEFAAGQPPKRANDIPFTFATGGAGLVAPIDDYLRFGRMMLAEGQLDGTRVLSAATVRTMMANHLDPAIQPRHFLTSPGMGYGLGASVRIAPTVAGEAPSMVGEYSWGGMASTLHWVDPANQLVAVFFAQKLPFDNDLHNDFRRAVYG